MGSVKVDMVKDRALTARDSSLAPNGAASSVGGRGHIAQNCLKSANEVQGGDQGNDQPIMMRQPMDTDHVDLPEEVAPPPPPANLSEGWSFQYRENEDQAVQQEGLPLS